MSNSRRKQFHPNKFGARENMSPNDKRNKVDNNINGKLIKDEINDAASSSVIQPGATFGPFAYLQNDLKNIVDGENVLELVDVHNKKHSYCMKDSLAFQWIQQLQVTTNMQECNCLLRDDGQELKLTVVKQVSSIKDFVVGLEIAKHMVNGHGSNPEVTSPQSSDSMPILAPEKQPNLTKNFLCTMCGTRFSNPRTLEAHQTFYCSKQAKLAAENQSEQNEVAKNTSTSSMISIDCGVEGENPAIDPSTASRLLSSSPAALLTNMANFMQSASPPVILLPCAFTDNDVMQIIGYPQTIIPVAVSRSLKIPLRPLILEESLTNGVDFSADHVLIEQKAENGDKFKLPLAMKTSSGQINLLSSEQQPVPNQRPKSASKKTVDKSSSPLPFVSRSQISSPATSLALSDKPSTSTISVSSAVHPSVPTNPVLTVTHISVIPNPPISKPVKPANPPKAFPCPNCGVTFSNEKTLDGHLSFYCTANKNQLKDPKITRKLIENQRLCCQFCDWTTSTTAEILEHTKVAHGNLSKSPYNCQSCGYRGHSLRGIKSHMKHAHSNDVATSSKSHESSDTDKKSPSVSDADTPKSSSDQSDEPDPKRRRASYPTVANRNFPRSVSDGPSFDDDLEKKLETTETCNDHRCASASSSNGQPASTSSSSTKYKCKFCSYQSPYKGNVKRHLVLVHKNESNFKVKEESN